MCTCAAPASAISLADWYVAPTATATGRSHTPHCAAHSHSWLVLPELCHGTRASLEQLDIKGGEDPWAPRTRKRHQQPQRPTESSDPAQHAKGRTGDCPGPRKETTTRRIVTQGDPFPPKPPPPQTKVTIVGEIYNRENLIGPFLGHKLLGPSPPPPPQKAPCTAPTNCAPHATSPQVAATRPLLRTWTLCSVRPRPTPRPARRGRAAPASDPRTRTTATTDPSPSADATCSALLSRAS